MTERGKRVLVVACLITVGLAVVAWDVWLYLSPPANDTISYHVWSWGANHPGVILLVGVLLGHFWPVKRARRGRHDTELT